MLAILPFLLLASSEASSREAVAQPRVACTMEYRPVCGVKDGRGRTYPNACTARAAGARRIRGGSCRAN